MAYEWCSAISEGAGREGPEPTAQLPSPLSAGPGGTHNLEHVSELVRSGGTSNNIPGHQKCLTHKEYATLLSESLKIGFRLIQQSDRSTLDLDHTPHHKTFQMAFLSEDDETIADAVCAWIADSSGVPIGSLANSVGAIPTFSLAYYFIERVAKGTPFSLRLRQMCIHAIERVWRTELRLSGLNTVKLLNHLEVEMGDMVNNEKTWMDLLIFTIRSTFEQQILSPHYWHVLDKLALGKWYFPKFSPHDIDVMNSLETAENWENLTVWMTVIWQLDGLEKTSNPLPWQLARLTTGLKQMPMKEVERVTSRLLSQQPPALLRFKSLYEQKLVQAGESLKQICDQAEGQ